MGPMSETQNENTESVQDPDGDPGNLTEKAPLQPDQAEGEDTPEETGESTSSSGQ
jgi:hypothetical protein